MSRVAFIAGIGLLAFAVWAQTSGSTVVGKVTDASGAAIAGATVQFANLDTNERRPATAGADGTFAAAQLAPGTYVVEAAREGFRTAMKSNLKIQADQTVRLDFTLTP